MTLRMQELAGEIVRLQDELNREIEARREALGWRLEKGLVEFEHSVTIAHRRLRLGVAAFLAQSPMLFVLTAPVIYSLIVPLVLIDAWASLYQAICFRVYRIPQVRRWRYVVVDRQKLAYLNGIEALNCVYCGYGNGVIAYVREIASRTEQYWCPIKHAGKVVDPHQRYYEFLEFGDADGYRAQLDQFRERLRQEATSDAAKPAPKP
ncbi:MAG: hypothetical protein ACLPGW_18815 [Roseiarcus sp.]